MRAWKIVLLALGGLRRTPLRVTLTVLGVAIASAALVSMVAFALGLQRQLEAPMKLLALLNDIHVSPRDPQEEKERAARNRPASGGPAGQEAKESPAAKETQAPAELPPLDDAAVEQLSRLPGVAAAFPNIRLRGVKVRRGDRSEGCLALAVPREATLLGVAEEIIVAGRFFAENRQPEAIIGTPMVQSLGFASPREAIGAKLIIEAGGLSPDEEKSFTYQRKQFEVTVVGVYDLPGIVPPTARAALVLPLDIMKEVPGIHFEAVLKQLKTGKPEAANCYDSVIVRVRQTSDIPAVEAAIRKLGFRTNTVLSHFQEMQTFLVFLQALLAAVGTVALVVAALGIVNTLLMAVLERSQEIGICKALGASNGDMLVLFITEAAIIGVLGGLLGLGLGRVVSYVLEVALTAFARHQGFHHVVAMFAFPPWLLAGAVLFAVVVSMAAGVYPAMRAARMDPIRALRSG